MPIAGVGSAQKERAPRSPQPLTEPSPKGTNEQRKAPDAPIGSVGTKLLLRWFKSPRTQVGDFR